MLNQKSDKNNRKYCPVIIDKDITIEQYSTFNKDRLEL